MKEKLANLGPKRGRGTPPSTCNHWTPKTVFSPFRLYRYVLYREWDPTLETIAFIGLNPSTADETQDDPTIRRCIGFAKKWGYGSILVGNIFALRSTDPKKLYKSDNPVGYRNDYWLGEIYKYAKTTVACWGTHGALNRRHNDVKQKLGVMHVFGFTKEGFPKHPLYLSSKAKIHEWWETS
jgi:hypothetical protein